MRGNPPKAQLPPALAEIVSETALLWRKHHLGYDQTKYVVEQARRRLKLEPVRTRRRTVNRLDKSEIERLIRSSYQSRSKYGLMIKTLFLSGARVDEFVHIRIEDLNLDGDPPQIYLSQYSCLCRSFLVEYPSGGLEPGNEGSRGKIRFRFFRFLPH